MSKWFYDASSPLWIKIFRVYAIVFFWLTAIGGLVFGILDDAAVIDIFYEDGYGWLVWGAVGVLYAFIGYVINMLIINFLHNIQKIREVLEASAQSK